MLSSWLTAWAITNTDTRFDDLINRRSAEFWKLDLLHIKNLIKDWKKQIIPEAILEEAINDNNFNIVNNQNFIEWVKSGKITDEIIWTWIFKWYKKWANKIIEEYCKICKIRDFNTFLKDWLNTINNEEKEKHILKEFEKYLWKDLKDYEFIPYIPWIELVFKRLTELKIWKEKEKYKKRISDLLLKIDKVINKLIK